MFIKRKRRQEIKGLGTNSSKYITHTFPRMEVMGLPTIANNLSEVPLSLQLQIITRVRAGARDVIGLLKEER